MIRIWSLFLYFMVLGNIAEAIEIPVDKKINAIVIESFGGDILVTPSESKKLTLTVNKRLSEKASSALKEMNEDWSVRWEKVADKIVIKVTPPSDKTIWRQYLRKGGWPVFNLKIVAPQLPLEISNRKGTIDIKNWQRNIEATVLNGNMEISGGKGDLSLSLQQGKLNLSNQQGSVIVNNFKTQVAITQLKGSLSLSNFEGTTQVTQSEGTFEMKGHRGAIKVTESQGKLQFTSGDNSTRIEQFEGSVKGKSGQGRITVRQKGKINLNLKTVQGKVDIRAKGSGASVNVGSKEGPLYLPGFLKLTRSANMKIRTGRLRGGASGRVYVRTDSGSVQLR